MIKKEEVKKIAFLGKIKLTDKEITKFQGELNEVLEYVDRLKKATFNRVAGKSPRIKNIFRDDESKNEKEVDLDVLIQKNKEGSQLKVLNVFKKEK